MASMNTPAPVRFAALATAMLALGAACSEVESHTSDGVYAPAVTQNGITIDKSWLRPAADGMRMTAGYGAITNEGDEADSIVSVSAPVAGTVELHQSIRENGVSSMRRVEGMTIMPGETITLAPGGYHLMLLDLTGPVEDGEIYEVTVTFEKAGAVSVPMTGMMSEGMAGMDHH